MSSARRSTDMDRWVLGSKVKDAPGRLPPGGVSSLCHTVDDHDPGLDVRFEHAVRPPLREAHIVAKLGRLATDLTLTGHVEIPSALVSLNGTWSMLRRQREPKPQCGSPELRAWTALARPASLPCPRKSGQRRSLLILLSRASTYGTRRNRHR